MKENRILHQVGLCCVTLPTEYEAHSDSILRLSEAGVQEVEMGMAEGTKGLSVSVPFHQGSQQMSHCSGSLR